MHSSIPGIFSRISTGRRIAFAAIGWLILICLLHYWLNFERSARQVIRMGYMPVVANLACPLLDYASRESGSLRFEALKFSSFAEMGEALRGDQIQAAFIIAPLAVVLHQQGAGSKIVYIGNRHESTLVYRKGLKVKSFRDLAGKSIAVPMRFSGHNLAARQLAEKHGLVGPDLNIVEMNPPDMPAALAVGALDAYFVGEPFAAKTLNSGDAKVLHYVEEVWPGFICNLVIVNERLIENHPDWVKTLVRGAARAGLWAKKHPKEAADIAAEYWNQPSDLVEWTFNNPPNRFVYDRFVPKEDEIKYLAEQMEKFKLIENSDISGLVDDRFAKEADLSGIDGLSSILNTPKRKTTH